MGKLTDRKLGIVFNLKASQAKEAGFEETEREQWPSIARIDQLDLKGKMTLAPYFPELRVGCRLTKIGDKEIAEEGTKFADFKKDFQARPLRLRFSVPDGQEKLFEPWPTAQWPVSKRASSVPEWVKAGLDEVKKVAKHEKAEQKKAETPALQEQLARAQDEISVLKQQLEEARAQARAATVAAAAGGARSGDSDR